MQNAAWGLSVLTISLAVLVWGQSFRWNFERLSLYGLFPLLGLVAFSLMWGHYIMSAVRQYLKLDKAVLAKYFTLTSAVVLVAILLHPGLLIYQLWRDGFGLPPGSYLNNYVAPSLAWATILGWIALIIFLLYEFRRRFSDRPWWKYALYANDLAIIAIFIHGLRLGRHLQAGWFRGMWFFYGMTLLIALIYINRLRVLDKSWVSKQEV